MKVGAGNFCTDQKKIDAVRKGGARGRGKVKIGAGNKRKGQSKVEAQLRSSLKRSASRVLIVKEEWAKLILSGRKTWELRSSNTSFRGNFHLGVSGANGVIIGRVCLTGSREVSREELMNTVDKHMVTNLDEVTYHRVWAWELAHPMPFEKPFSYKHKRGAIIWIKL